MQKNRLKQSASVRVFTFCAHRFSSKLSFRGEKEKLKLSFGASWRRRTANIAVIGAEARQGEMKKSIG